MSKRAYYFSHDSNARNSDKLIKVRMSLGAEGYGVYFMIIERLREETDYTSIKDYNVIAFDLRVDSSIVKKVIEDFGLFVFTEDGKYFYSESLLRRMEMMDAKSRKKSEAGKKGAAKRWGKGNKNETKGNDIAEPSKNNSSAMAEPSKNIATKLKETKLKERDTKPSCPTDEKKDEKEEPKDVKPKPLTEQRFDEFWALYPKKVGKKVAFTSWKKAKVNKELHEKIIKAVTMAKNTEQWQRENGRYIPNPTTWINQGRWDDEYEEGIINGVNSQYSNGNNQQPTAPAQGAGGKQDALAGFKTIDDYDFK